MGILQEDVEGDVGAVPRCQACGSARVARDAWACWNPDPPPTCLGVWPVGSALFMPAHSCAANTTWDS